MNNDRFKKLMKNVHNFLIFFLLVSFLISCCVMLFVSLMTITMDLKLTANDIGTAAKLTMANVVFLSILLFVCDRIRRRIIVERPVKRIVDASQKIMQGDFSVRIPKNHGIGYDERFDEIADCFNKMAKELEGVETLRTDFVSNVSHELKTPLSVIQNYGTLLQSPDISENDRMEYAKEITSASRKLAALVTNILKLNKLENQQITAKKQSFDISAQVCECFLGFEEIWEKKNIEIETDVEDDIFVESDPELLELIWNNLFSNAFKFTNDGGKVSLSVKKQGEYAVVRISDTGCGISKDVGKHIFDKFYQGDTSHSMQGNGLGLALVKRVVDILGANITVESELNIGSVFTVYLKRE